LRKGTETFRLKLEAGDEASRSRRLRAEELSPQRAEEGTEAAVQLLFDFRKELSTTGRIIYESLTRSVRPTMLIPPPQ
jgi:hypothetical protein